MNHLAKTVFLILAATLEASAQSGRNRPIEIVVPPAPRPSVAVTFPRESSPNAVQTPTPRPRVVPTPDETEGEETLRVESTLVPIPVSVTDAQGRSITNLTLKDFQLQVDGKAEQITEISQSESPVRLALLFDNSSSVTSAREFEKEAATRFLERVLRPAKDRAALFSISTVSSLTQPLTSDVRGLVRAVKTFPEPAGATALFDAVVNSANYLYEKTTDGRRVIVIVSDGVDTISDSTLEDAVRESLLAGCQIFVVKTTDFENFKRTGQRRTNENLRDPAAERRMQQLAATTGGAVYSPIDERELDAAFASIAAELAQQYILSYYPVETNAKKDFHEIRLSVARPGLTVRTRKGYYVPKS